MVEGSVLVHMVIQIKKSIINTVASVIPVICNYCCGSSSFYGLMGLLVRKWLPPIGVGIEH